MFGYEDRPLVSADYVGSSYSATFDANQTQVVGGNLVEIHAWYDNEWGFSARMIQLAQWMAQQNKLNQPNQHNAKKQDSPS